MTERTPPSAAAALFPHLSQGTPGPVKQPQPALANALYPSLVPKPQSQPQPAPRPARSMEWIRDWSGVDPNYARACGLIPKQGRR